MGARPNSPLAWGVVNTWPHKESYAIQNLDRQGFASYCPKIRKRIKHARFNRDELRPLFPGYLFVEINRDSRNWRPILSTFGVKTLIRGGGQPFFLVDGFVAALKARENDGAILKPSGPALALPDRANPGYLEMLTPTLVEMSENDRVSILMGLLERG